MNRVFVLEDIAARYGLACLRLAPLFVLPGLSPFAWAPALIRIVVLLVFAAVLAFGSPTEPTLANHSPGQLGLAALVEFTLGLALAFAIALPAAALAFSARLADTQSGFSAANLLNPSLESEAESLLGTALALTATVLFFSLDLHLQVLDALARVMEIHPIGALSGSLDSNALLAAISRQFLLGLMVCAPVVMAMFAIDLGTAYATRSMPQANVYFLALPIKVLAALLVFAESARFFPQLIGRMYADSIDSLFHIVK